MDFRKVIYESVGKKTFISQKHIYIYGSQKFYLVHYAYIPPYMHKTLPTLEMRKNNNSKLNFTKNLRAS